MIIFHLEKRTFVAEISSRKINENDFTMDLKIGDIQETALITLAIRASETDRPNARIKDFKAKEQVTTCLNMLCNSFDQGYLLAELHHPILGKNTKHHDAVKYTNAQFQWGTKSGKEYLDLEPRLTLLSERSYNEEMRKHSFRAKLFAFFLPFLNNRLAVYKW